MRVFILCTGRCGSVSVINACQFIDNYSAGHESLAAEVGKKRFAYPKNHIEADNRLSWHLGELNTHFGDDAFYVHLKRDRQKTANSFMKRYFEGKSIMDAFVGGIRKNPPQFLSEEERLQFCYDYVDTVTANITHFLADKSQVMEMHLETLQDDFPKFWEKIDATGDLEKALEDLQTKHNSSKKKKTHLGYGLKLFMLKQWEICKKISRK